MKVLFDARMAGHSGVGRHLRSLLRAMPAEGGPEVTVLFNPGQETAWAPERMARRILPKVVEIYSLEESTEIPRHAAGFDLLHVPHFNVPWTCPVPLVATVHDAIYWRFPGATGSALGGLYARIFLKRAVRTARRVLTVSEATARDLRDLLGADPAKLRVVLNGPPDFHAEADPDRVALAGRAWGAPDGWLLYVGNALPHKGLDVLLAALNLLRVQGRRIPLVLVGREDDRMEALRRSDVGRRLRESLVFTGALGDRELREAYAGARVLACPSPWEGFGLPMLEGMAWGVPVVAADSGAAPEVAGGAALLARPGDPVDLARRILEAWSVPEVRERLSRAGRERVKAFSWERAARETTAAWEGALS